MAWGLDLYDLKVIANNSLKYSLIPEARKLEGYSKFETEWNTFVNELYESVCDTAEASTMYQVEKLNVSDLMPPYGPNDAPTEVTIFGYGFELAFCKELYCLFDNILVDAVMTNLDQIRCSTPLGFDQNSFANVSLQIDDVVYDTGFKYKFVASNSISVIDDHVDDGKKKQQRYLPEIFSCDNPIFNDFFTYKCRSVANANFDLNPIFLLIFVMFIVYYAYNSKKAVASSTQKHVIVSQYNYRNLEQSKLDI
jgi:hypothetical protein